MNIELTEDDIKRLRDTRLHFWLELVGIRGQQKLSNSLRVKFIKETNAMHERKAMNCLKHVQTLNIFFDTPNFDTAERDYEKLMRGEYEFSK